MQHIHYSIVSLWKPIPLDRGVFSLLDRKIEKRAIFCDRSFVSIVVFMVFVRWAIAQTAIESGAESLDYKTRLVFEIVAMAGACDRNFGKQSKIVFKIAREYSTAIKSVARVVTFFLEF